MPLSPCSPSQSPIYNTQVQDACIIRVSLENGNGNLYKSILVCKHTVSTLLEDYFFWDACFHKQLTSQDKTPAVISRAMAKHNLEAEPEEGYELVQVISEEKGKT